MKIGSMLLTAAAMTLLLAGTGSAQDGSASGFAAPWIGEASPAPVDRGLYNCVNPPLPACVYATPPCMLSQVMPQQDRDQRSLSCLKQFGYFRTRPEPGCRGMKPDCRGALSCRNGRWACDQVACTMEAKLCPDGKTSVGRDSANGCAFKACPQTGCDNAPIPNCISETGMSCLNGRWVCAAKTSNHWFNKKD